MHSMAFAVCYQFRVVILRLTLHLITQNLLITSGASGEGLKDTSWSTGYKVSVEILILELKRECPILAGRHVFYFVNGANLAAIFTPTWKRIYKRLLHSDVPDVRVFQVF